MDAKDTIELMVNPGYWEHLLVFTFFGHPVPYTRMTQRGLWMPAAQAYLAYKKALADSLRTSFPDLVIAPAPPTRLAIERARYNREQNLITYALGVDVYLAKDAGDWSNFYKGAEDALQTAGMIWNDRKMTDSLGGKRRIDKKNPRIEIMLYRHIEPEKAAKKGKW